MFNYFEILKNIVSINHLYLIMHCTIVCNNYINIYYHYNINTYYRLFFSPKNCANNQYDVYVQLLMFYGI